MNHYLDTTLQAHAQYFPTPTKPVIWDVGSRDAEDAVELAERLGSGEATVYAVEANPAQALIIRETHPGVILYETAVSDVESEGVAFTVFEGDYGLVGSSSLNSEWKGDSPERHTVTVGVTTLHKLMDPEEIVSIMKIDVEGFSLEVLKGMGDKLRQVEVFHIETEEWTGSHNKVMAFMRDNGYLMYDWAIQYGGMPDQVWVRVPQKRLS